MNQKRNSGGRRGPIHEQSADRTSRRGRRPANKGQRYPAEILAADEVRALIRACSNRAPSGVRNRALLVLLYRAGCRISEALRLLPKDLNRAAGTVTVLRGRTPIICTLKGKPAVHPLAIRSPFAALADVRQYQVVYDGQLAVRVVPCDGVVPERVAATIRSVLGAKLAELGVAPVPIAVGSVAAITRDAGHSGKLKLIECRRPPASAHRASASA